MLFRLSLAGAIHKVLGVAFCVVPEAIDNYLGGVYWSQSHVPGDIMFVLMGREFDCYVAIMWWAFGAILGYIVGSFAINGIFTPFVTQLAGVLTCIVSVIMARATMYLIF